MEIRANYLLAGSFVVGLIACLFIFLLWFGGGDSNQYKKYIIYFTQSVSGLEEGGPVRFRGIPVGNVASIRVDPQNIERTEVMINIEKETPVKTDTFATLNYQGVTGIAFVELVGATQGASDLVAKEGQKYPVIPSRTSSLAKVVEKAPDMLAEFTKVAIQAGDLLNDKNIVAFGEAVQNMRQVSAAIAGRAGDIDRLISDSAIAAEKIARAADRIERISQSLAQDMPATVESIRATSANLASSTGELKETIEENHQGITNSVTGFNRLVKDSGEVVKQSKGLVQELRAQPSRVLFSEERKGYEARE